MKISIRKNLSDFIMTTIKNRPNIIETVLTETSKIIFIRCSVFCTLFFQWPYQLYGIKKIEYNYYYYTERRVQLITSISLWFSYFTCTKTPSENSIIVMLFIYRLKTVSWKVRKTKLEEKIFNKVKKMNKKYIILILISITCCNRVYFHTSCKVISRAYHDNSYLDIPKC